MDYLKIKKVKTNHHPRLPKFTQKNGKIAMEFEPSLTFKTKFISFHNDFSQVIR